MPDSNSARTFADLSNAAAATTTLLEKIKELVSAGQIEDREAIGLLADAMTAHVALTEKMVGLLQTRLNADDGAIQFAQAQVQVMQQHTSLIDGLQARISKLEASKPPPPSTPSNN